MRRRSSRARASSSTRLCRQVIQNIPLQNSRYAGGIDDCRLSEHVTAASAFRARALHFWGFVMPFGYNPAQPIYIHVINKLRNFRYDEFFEAMTAECLPLYDEHGVRLHGCWESAPGQGQGPETIEVWELKDFDVYSRFLAASRSGGDPRLRTWQRLRDEWVATNESMLCLPHPASPTTAQLAANGTKAKLVLHDDVHTNPSMQAEYLDGMMKHWWKLAEGVGHVLIGLYYSPWHNRRAIRIQGMGPEWDDLRIWNQNYSGDTDDFRLWMSMSLALRDDFNDRFMMPAPFSPIK
jgi:hypothetical protein